MRHVINRIDECSSASDVAKKVNVLDAILWLKSAWDSVKAVTIERCFAKCGFLDTLVDAQDEDEGAHVELGSELES